MRNANAFLPSLAGVFGLLGKKFIFLRSSCHKWNENWFCFRFSAKHSCIDKSICEKLWKNHLFPFNHTHDRNEMNRNWFLVHDMILVSRLSLYLFFNIRLGIFFFDNLNLRCFLCSHFFRCRRWYSNTHLEIKLIAHKNQNVFFAFLHKMNANWCRTKKKVKSEMKLQRNKIPNGKWNRLIKIEITMI